MTTRKVQRLGYSTLVVSLPKEWCDEVGIKRGDEVLLEREEDGSLRIFPKTEREQEKNMKSIVNADLCYEPGLLTRILTGNYILGHDTIQVVSKKELSPEHLQEVRETSRRLMGMGIVEQTLQTITLQSFVDPTKFPVNGLIRRLHVLTWSMLEAATHALFINEPDMAKEALRMEEEVDRIYWLLMRQLLLASRDTSVMKKLGLKSIRQIVGSRAIAKYIEEMADYAENIALEVLKIRGQNYLLYRDVLERMLQLNELVKIVSDKTMRAFFSGDIKLANDIIETAKQAENEERKLVEKIVMQVNDVNVAVALKSIVWSLRQIARYCEAIAEITINKTLGKSSEVCWFENVKSDAMQ
ncbi:MAG: PhoU domain-containing protein [Candidatus Freyarchaeota archaeon]